MKKKNYLMGAVAAGRLCALMLATPVNAANSSSQSTTSGSGQVLPQNPSGNTSNASVVSNWKPTTPEEKAIFALVGAEDVKTTIPNGKATMINSVQGPKCYDVFKAFAGDYTLARTYSIFPEGADVKNPVYETATPITVTYTIPASLQSANRTYSMIGVTKGGAAQVYKDEDTNPNTVTFTTNHFYAYALCYKNN